MATTTTEEKRGPHRVVDTSITRCQCIMRHYDLLEGGLAQCDSRRDPSSNLFCKECEKTHGDYWRKKHPEAGGTTDE